MKQNDVATLPANAGQNAKTPVQAKIAPVKSASTDAAATRMTTSPDGATSGPAGGSRSSIATARTSA